MDNQECAFGGNGDIYGLGVRVGIYLQWLTTILAVNLYPAAVESVRNANTTFQVAMFAGFIFITRGAGAVRAIEGYFALLFCLATVWIATLQVVADMRIGKRANADAPRQAGQEARGLGDLLLATAVCAYGIWYLFVGLDNLARVSDTPRCQELIFFFAPVALFGWYRNLMRVLLVVSFVVCATLAVARFLFILDDLLGLLAAWNNPTRLSPRHTALVQAVRISALKLLGCVLALVIFVVAMEMTLIWNRVKDVNACNTFSQLFPLLVGGANLARIMYQALRAVMLGDIKLEWTWWTHCC
ncbi:hypothetical protein HJFPF1_08180 [Paramyrothecium foliicola]|nr:hypothetical protein HJFPF1_08180 [Paramyrothecium foliicola]